jgi:hypothetical protein
LPLQTLSSRDLTAQSLRSDTPLSPWLDFNYSYLPRRLASRLSLIHCPCRQYAYMSTFTEFSYHGVRQGKLTQAPPAVHRLISCAVGGGGQLSYICNRRNLNAVRFPVPPHHAQPWSLILPHNHQKMASDILTQRIEPYVAEQPTSEALTSEQFGQPVTITIVERPRTQRILHPRLKTSDSNTMSVPPHQYLEYPAMPPPQHPAMPPPQYPAMRNQPVTGWLQLTARWCKIYRRHCKLSP